MRNSHFDAWKSVICYKIMEVIKQKENREEVYESF